MQYFSTDYVAFFKELQKNNTKEWFQENRKRYETSVKDPFKAFTAAMIAAIKKEEPELNLEAGKVISRINRDIRFSKDKTPYNTHLNCFLGRGGKKNKSIPGMALRLSHEKIWIMGGSYGPEKEVLYRMRRALVADPDSIETLLMDPTFSKTFGSIQGEKSKRIPKEWKAAAEKQALILHKNFYFMAEESPDLIADERLVDRLMDYYHAMRPMNEYLYSIMQ